MMAHMWKYPLVRLSAGKRQRTSMGKSFPSYSIIYATLVPAPRFMGLCQMKSKRDSTRVTKRTKVVVREAVLAKRISKYQMKSNRDSTRVTKRTRVIVREPVLAKTTSECQMKSKQDSTRVTKGITVVVREPVLAKASSKCQMKWQRDNSRATKGTKVVVRGPVLGKATCLARANPKAKAKGSGRCLTRLLDACQFSHESCLNISM
mmetsp:Transcript_15122/g.31666  ORF Transcript_15122/g.31666 Transcript_15122/m.31666 type:complete len:206 (-) Transcript_15122:255-872(-)